MSFADRLKAREKMVGYWSQLPVAAVQERVARFGYDYVCLDAQHGLLDPMSVLNGLVGISAGASIAPGPCAGLVRVAANDATVIGQALDYGAEAVIVPLVDSPEDARRAVAACRYPTAGGRSYGPVRAGLRFGPRTPDMNRAVSCIAMIETAEALDAVEAIAAVPGLDALYVGPADLALGIGAEVPGDPAVQEAFDAALARIRAAGASAGIAVGIHTMAGAVARSRLDEGFDFVSVSSDLNHLDLAAGQHLRAARGDQAK